MRKGALIAGVARFVVAGSLFAAGWAACAAPLLQGNSSAVAPADRPEESRQAEAPGSLAGSQDNAIGDIVVYAQKRAVGESVQNVPIAITALDGDTIAAVRAVSLADLGGLAPGTRLAPLGTVPGFPSFTIRGIGINSSTRSIDPAVNIIQDGMVIAYQAGAIGSTFDLEAIEVLRGPQGVLFGRNATGGAIVLRTRRPGREVQGLLDVSYGNFNEINASASVEGPLGSDDVLGKLAVIYRRNTGRIRNDNAGTFAVAPGNPAGANPIHPTGHVGDIDELTIKPTFHFDISGRTRLTLFTQYARYNDDGTIGRAFPTPAGLSNPLARAQFGYTPAPPNGYRTNIDDPGYVRLRAGHAIAELENDLGAGILTTNLAYRRISFDSTINLAGAPFVGLRLVDNREDNEQYSLESRYNVTLRENLDLTAGVFYLHSDTHVIENRFQRLAAALQPAFLRGEFTQRTEAIAGFANVEWRIVEGLKLALGGRYSSDKKDLRFARIVPCPTGLANCSLTFTDTSERWNDFSPRAVLTWQPADRILLYASYTSGFRSGNYNPRITPGAQLVGPANPESVEAFEIGAKTDFLDRRLRFNLAVYQNSYDDIQQVVNIPQQSGTATAIQDLVNVARGRIRGVEAEATARPVRGLTLEANAAYTEAEYLRFNTPLVIPTTSSVTNLIDLKFPNVSKWTYFLAGTFVHDLPSLEGNISFRLSYDWRSSYISDFFNTRGLTQKSFGLTNANVEFKRDNWSIGAYARNIFNVYYADTKSFAFTYQDVGGNPRTYGARATFRF